MKKLWEKYREIILYLVFGVLTTLVGMGTYFLMLWAAERLFAVPPEAPAYHAVRAVAQVVQWVLAVLFAYVTNKKYVFRVEEGNEGRRLGGFFAARLFSLGVDSAVTFGTVFTLSATGYVAFESNFGFLPFVITFSADLWSKIAAAVVVIVVNYLLSKFLVFRTKKDDVS
jgi:putative flippase GtrA